MALTLFTSIVRANRRCNMLSSRISYGASYKFSSSTKNKDAEEEDIEKSVFISQSHNVFSNLALEDWMYRNWDFSKHHVMFLWRNEPCVVVGRHQNPWVETDTNALEESGLPLARRNSGGGAVYHDKGNLNITFFTSRNRYNRLHNLNLIVETLRSEWNLDVEINPRQDIMLDKNFKVQVSGTASKLGRPNAYHHCTLLVDVDKENLTRVLHHNPQKEGIVTNATGSLPSATMNLGEAGVEMERLMTALGWAYLASCPVTHTNGGWAQVATTRGFQLVSPTDDWFPGLGSLKEELEKWDWVYGKTPKFEVRREVGEGLAMVVEVEKGLVGGVSLEIPHQSLPEPIRLVSSLTGQRYTPHLLEALHRQVAIQAPPLLRPHLPTPAAAIQSAVPT